MFAKQSGSHVTPIPETVEERLRKESWKVSYPNKGLRTITLMRMLLSKAVYVGVSLEEHIVLSDLIDKLEEKRDPNFASKHLNLFRFAEQLLVKLAGLQAYPSKPIKDFLETDKVPEFLPSMHAFFGWHTTQWKNGRSPWRIVFTNPLFPKRLPPKRWMGVGHRDNSHCRRQHELDPLDPVFAQPEAEKPPTLREMLHTEEGVIYLRP